MSLLYHAYACSGFLILACTIYILAPHRLIMASDMMGKSECLWKKKTGHGAVRLRQTTIEQLPSRSQVTRAIRMQ